MALIDKAMGMMVAGAILLAAPLAYAKEPPTLDDLDQNAALSKAFKGMAGKSPMPDWVQQGIVVTPTQTARFDGKSWLVMSGCKQHDCASQQIAVIYSPETGAMHGVLSETAEDEPVQTLRWLNIGGGAESIDGRTILFAALTGSLANHTESFDYGTE
ncbi:Ivy family c-type lysozyme inhibitor [Paracoccus sp. CPCC 101403]|uniref:Ivy family c-type lysozyme inhibitor n=1 Tax=Paracoccus broussonetiae TaxID=3075834 RepID=A0ABU3EBN4_9RHOB|nr:Ivy family c-type lysozyme inhibitor [Paracoccus sp. CPCC 101403]MDT1061632.1 Ivy family c-type lysozyme inhibitor [Paracoccus sp. CPCC 101403]